jgi:hypothetical protein
MAGGDSGGGSSSSDCSMSHLLADAALISLEPCCGSTASDLLSCWLAAGAYLDELQHLDEWNPTEESLPAIAEHAAEGPAPPAGAGAAAKARPSPLAKAAALPGDAAGSSSAGLTGGGSPSDAAGRLTGAGASQAEVARGFTPADGVAAGRGSSGGVGLHRAAGPPPGGLSRAAPFVEESLLAAAGEEEGVEETASSSQSLAAGTPPPAGPAPQGGGPAAVGMQPAEREDPWPGQGREYPLGAAAHASQPASTSAAAPGRALPLHYPQQQYQQHELHHLHQQQQQQQQHYGGAGQAPGVGARALPRSGPNTPRSPPLPPYWRGAAAGMEPGAGGSHMGFLTGPGALTQISPGQASFGVVSMQHMSPMIPVLHPVPIQYGVQYAPSGVAVPVVQYGHPMPAPVQMSARMMEGAGGGWVPVQPAYWGEAPQLPHLPQHQQHPQQDPGAGRRFPRG